MIEVSKIALNRSCPVARVERISGKPNSKFTLTSKLESDPNRLISGHFKSHCRETEVMSVDVTNRSKTGVWILISGVHRSRSLFVRSRIGSAVPKNRLRTPLSQTNQHQEIIRSQKSSTVVWQPYVTQRKVIETLQH